VLNEVRLISVPSRRIYAKKNDIPKVMNGLGIAILTTSAGVLSDAEARQKRRRRSNNLLRLVRWS